MATARPETDQSKKKPCRVCSDFKTWSKHQKAKSKVILRSTISESLILTCLNTPSSYVQIHVHVSVLLYNVQADTIARFRFVYTYM